MTVVKVAQFRRFPLEPGQRIRILDGPRSGDWYVIGVDDRKVKLKCPVSGREVEWDRFTDYEGFFETSEWPDRRGRENLELPPLPEFPPPSAPLPEAESETRYRLLVEQNPLAICIHQDGHCVFVNPAAVKLMGADSEADLTNRPALDFVHPSHREKVLERMQTMNLLGETVPRIEELFIRMDGSPLPVEVVAGPVSYHGKPAIQVLAADISERKKLEAALRESELKYRTLVENSPDVVIWVDPAFRHIYVSKNIKQSFGMGEEAFLGRTIDELPMPEESREFWKEKIGEVLNTGKPLETECTLIVRGKRKVFEWRLTPELGANGAVLSVLSVARDITEKQKADKELLNSRKALSRAQAIAHMGSWCYCPTDKSIVWSDELYEIFGVERKSFNPAGKEFLEAVHEADRERVKAALAAAIEGHAPYHIEHRIRRPDNSVHHVSLRGEWQTNENGKDELNGTALDITELRVAEERLRLAMDGAGLAFWDYKPLSNELYLSARWFTQLGYEPDEFRHSVHTYTALIHPDDQKMTEESLIQAMKTGLPMDIQFRMLAKDGGWRYIRSSAKVLERNSEGLATRMCGVHQDVTEMRELEAQLRQAQKMEALGTLAGGVAHDFNNILSAIIGYSELAYKQSEEGSEQQRYLAAVLNASGRARDIVKQILAFSRKTDEKKSVVDIGAVAMESLGLLRATIPSNITIKSGIDEAPALAFGNGAQLQQVVTNLVTNAYQAVKEKGGTINLEVGNLEVTAKKQLTVGHLLPGTYAFISVRDTGKGMPPQVMEKIFDPFFTTKNVGEGTGLGLSVVHGIVSQMGGAIDVHSERGKGSEFRVYLPKLADQARLPGAPPRDEPLTKEEKRLKILFVDDEPTLADLGKTLLETLGHEAAAVESPAEALELFEKEAGNFDLVISDQTMPGMTGLELLKKLTELKPGLSTIICTGFSDALNQTSMAASHARYLLMKPFSMENLKKAIAKAVGG